MARSCGSSCTTNTVSTVQTTPTTCDNPSQGTMATIFPFNPANCPEMPRIPHTFSGCVFINGAPAPAGTRVEVRGTNVQPNELILTSNCIGYSPFDPKIVARGTSIQGGMLNIPEGEPLTFWVNGEKARVCRESGSCYGFCSYHTGHHTVITLKVESCAGTTCI